MKFVGTLFLAALCLGLLFPASYLLYISSITLIDELALRAELSRAITWPAVPMRVVEAGKVDPPKQFLPIIPEFRCKFTYEFEGRRYTTTWAKFSGFYGHMAMNRGGLEKRYAKPLYGPAEPGKPLKAYVNPNDPARAVPVDAVNDLALGTELAGACFALMLGLGMLAGAIGPPILLLRSAIRGKEAATARVDPRFLEADSGPKWIWFGIALLLTPGVLPMAAFTLPALLKGGDEPSYGIVLGLQFALPLPFWLFFLRARRWWKTAGQSRIEKSIFPATLQSPPRGKLRLAPMTDMPRTLTIRYELIRRITSKSVTTFFRGEREVTACGDVATGDVWYPLEETFAGEPKLSVLRPTNHTTMWILRATGRTAGRRFMVQFIWVL